MTEKRESNENMDCAEFQKVLPFAMEDGTLEDQEHLKHCTACAELVADLDHIASQAKLLLPMHDPSPAVWDRIQMNLEREGLIAVGRMPRLGLTRIDRQVSRWSPMVWAASMAAVLLLSIGVIQLNRPQPGVNQQAAISGSSGTQSSSEQDDQILVAVAQRSPAMKDVYASNLKNVNAYIADARTSLEQDPNSAEAHEYLREAYAQKAMLYDMATSRSMD